jgi:hypothetical protein
LCGQASQSIEFGLPADEHGVVEGQQLTDLTPVGKPRIGDGFVDVQIAPSNVLALLVDVSTSDQPAAGSVDSAGVLNHGRWPPAAR